jgi:hypothetical protein
VLLDPTQELKAALQEWQTTPSYSDMSFGGGGFGLGAAAKGMAMAWVLYSCVGYFNRLQGAGHHNRVGVQLNSVATKLVSLRQLYSPAAARVLKQLEERGLLDPAAPVDMYQQHLDAADHRKRDQPRSRPRAFSASIRGARAYDRSCRHLLAGTRKWRHTSPALQPMHAGLVLF